MFAGHGSLYLGFVEKRQAISVALSKANCTFVSSFTSIRDDIALIILQQKINVHRTVDLGVAKEVVMRMQLLEYVLILQGSLELSKHIASAYQSALIQS